MGYPADYGFIEHSLGEDGDPLGALVLLNNPIFPGVLVKMRPVGVSLMTDEAGPDAKIITVSASDPRWAHLRDIDDVPTDVLARIEHFFTHYKDLEPGKHTVVDGWDSRAAAQKSVDDAYDRVSAGADGVVHELPGDRTPTI